LPALLDHRASTPPPNAPPGKPFSDDTAYDGLLSLFDVNPGKRRQGRASRFRDYVRFSFGPSLENIERALTRLEELVASPPPPSSR